MAELTADGIVEFYPSWAVDNTENTDAIGKGLRGRGFKAGLMVETIQNQSHRHLTRPRQLVAATGAATASASSGLTGTERRMGRLRLY